MALMGCGQPTQVVRESDQYGNTLLRTVEHTSGKSHGPFKKMDKHGKLLEEAFYQHGELHGIRKLYYPDGAIESTEQFIGGKHEGPYLKYYPNGKTQIKQTFRNGKLEGESLAFYPNGEIKEIVQLFQNEEKGPFIEFYDNGNIKAKGTYLPGDDFPMETDTLWEYDSTGTLVRVALCREGRCTTNWIKK
jgi:antitoxin component YwqK of YwqJK toxin-antitoxin module